MYTALFANETTTWLHALSTTRSKQFQIDFIRICPSSMQHFMSSTVDGTNQKTISMTEQL